MYCSSARLPAYLTAFLCKIMADDFGIMDETKPKKGIPTSGTKGEKRKFLKVFETLPPQLLCAYGEAKFAKMADEDVWKIFSQPLKSGAMYMTELCSKDTERRGIGVNRWLKADLDFCVYQLNENVKKQNQVLLNPNMLKELYAEIDRIKPSLEYCLAPKKQAEKSGAASLRSCGIQATEVSKDPAMLDTHAKVLYDWLDTAQVSRVRMLQNWQSAAGISFVAAVHHRGAQCFRYYGNSEHGDGSTKEVSLIEFQDSIKRRHAIGSRGTEEGSKYGVDVDIGG